MSAVAQDVDREKIRSWLKLQYGTDKGTAWISVGTGRNTEQTFSENPFQWPEQAEEIVEFIAANNEAGYNVWYAAHLSYSAKRTSEGGEGRKKGRSVKRRRLHVDIDRVLTDEDRRKLAELDAWRVYTGSPGHVHAYIELAESIDVGTYHKLEDRLVRYLDCDSAVKCDNGLLRIPGTVNQMSAKKPHPTAPVLWEDKVSERRKWTKAELATLAGIDPTAPQKAASADVSSDPITPMEPGQMPAPVRELLNAPTPIDKRTGLPDRSAYTPTIVNACKANNLTIEQTLWCLMQNPDQAQRAKERGPRRTHREVRNLYGTADEYNAALSEDQRANDILIGTAGTETQPATPSLPSSWAEVSMDRIWDADYRMQETTMLFRDDDIGLLYPGKSHDFHGPSGSGKSWIAKIACAEQVRAGNRVLYLDYESDNESVGINFRQLGLTREQMQLISYRNPHEVAKAELLSTLTGYSIVVVDGCTACLASYGYSGNDNDEVAKWFHLLIDPLKRTGAAVIVIDHEAKANGGTFALGAMTKRALMDVSYRVIMTQQMVPGRAGELTVRLTEKERGSWVRKHCPDPDSDAVAALFQIVSDDDGNLTVKIEAPTLQQKVDAVQSMVETFTALGMPADDSFGREHVKKFLADRGVKGVRAATLTDAIRDYKARSKLRPE
ncbi:hypothetical protein AS590_10630 [Prescottella equi]|nr:hypothetical protein AS590_10630 [Prescottella equi]